MSEQNKEKRAARSPDNAGKSLRRVPAQWRRNYRRLVRLRTTLRTQLARTETGESRCFGVLLMNAAREGMDRLLALSLFSNERDALAEVEAALRRIREGTYGVCERSGAAILPSRLDLIPWARFTAEVQTEAEKDAAAAESNAQRAAAPEKRKPKPT